MEKILLVTSRGVTTAIGPLNFAAAKVGQKIIQRDIKDKLAVVAISELQTLQEFLQKLEK